VEYPEIENNIPKWNSLFIGVILMEANPEHILACINAIIQLSLLVGLKALMTSAAGPVT
jgi:hypothetical protein